MFAAPTVLLQQHFDAEAGCASPENPAQSALVFPRRGSFLVFDGSLGHGVLDGLGDSVRMTLLINWWTHQPQVRVRRLLTRLNRAAAASAAGRGCYRFEHTQTGCCFDLKYSGSKGMHMRLAVQGIVRMPESTAAALALQRSADADALALTASPAGPPALLMVRGASDPISVRAPSRLMCTAFCWSVLLTPRVYLSAAVLLKRMTSTPKATP